MFSTSRFHLLSSKKYPNDCKRSLDVHVTAMDAELDLSLSLRATGKDLFDMVCRTIGLRETWYFGLQYQDKKGFRSWLKMSKKLLKQGIAHNYRLSVFLLVKFYPEDVAKEIVQDITLHLFFLQVKQAILNMDLYCPSEVSVLLASYALQAKLGNADESNSVHNIINNEQLLPTSVMKQYVMTPTMWEERINTWYHDHKDMSRFDAEMEYLKIAQDLEMYGIDYFPIKNPNGSDLLLGVCAFGLRIYENNNKCLPKISFSWLEIRDLQMTENKFIIQVKDHAASTCYSFYSYDKKLNKLIIDLSNGNYDLHLRRRQPDSIEVQQMKSQANEERKQRQIQRDKLQRERQMRMDLERQKTEMEMYIVNFMERMKSTAPQVLMKAPSSVHSVTAEPLVNRATMSEDEHSVLFQRSSHTEEERVRQQHMKVAEERNALERRLREAEMLAAHFVKQSQIQHTETVRLKDELNRTRESVRQANHTIKDLVMNQSHSTSSNLLSCPSASSINMQSVWTGASVDALSSATTVSASASLADLTSPQLPPSHQQQLHPYPHHLPSHHISATASLLELNSTHQALGNNNHHHHYYHHHSNHHHGNQSTSAVHPVHVTHTALASTSTACQYYHPDIPLAPPPPPPSLPLNSSAALGSTQFVTATHADVGSYLSGAVLPPSGQYLPHGTAASAATHAQKMFPPPPSLLSSSGDLMLGVSQMNLQIEYDRQEYRQRSNSLSEQLQMLRCDRDELKMAHLCSLYNQTPEVPSHNCVLPGQGPVPSSTSRLFEVTRKNACML